MKAAPCVNPECRTTGGATKRLKDGMVPIRNGGLCNACYVRLQRRARGIQPRPPKPLRRPPMPFKTRFDRPYRWLPTLEEIQTAKTAIKREHMEWMRASTVNGKPHGYRVFKLAHPALDAQSNQLSI